MSLNGWAQRDPPLPPPPLLSGSLRLLEPCRRSASTVTVSRLMGCTASSVLLVIWFIRWDYLSFVRLLGCGQDGVVFSVRCTEEFYSALVAEVPGGTLALFHGHGCENCESYLYYNARGEHGATCLAPLYSQRVYATPSKKRIEVMSDYIYWPSWPHFLMPPNLLVSCSPQMKLLAIQVVGFWIPAFYTHTTDGHVWTCR